TDEREQVHSAFSMARVHPAATLFPYTTLFRSSAGAGCRAACHAACAGRGCPSAAGVRRRRRAAARAAPAPGPAWPASPRDWRSRSEEHTSELQSRENLVCRLLLEKKNTMNADV